LLGVTPEIQETGESIEQSCPILLEVPPGIEGAVGSIDDPAIVPELEESTVSAEASSSVQGEALREVEPLESEDNGPLEHESGTGFFRRVKQGVELVKGKTKDLMESEAAQRSIEFAKDTAKTVTDSTQKSFDFAKDKTNAVREGASSVWEQGRGSVELARGAAASTWRSAKQTLEVREEEWRNARIQGSEVATVPPRTEHTCVYHVAKGSTFRWTFRVKEYDIAFSIRMRVQVWGGSQEEDILAPDRYDGSDVISGNWVASEDRTLVLAFDNRYSKLRGKTIAYLVGVEKPSPCTDELSNLGCTEAEPQSVDD